MANDIGNDLQCVREGTAMAKPSEAPPLPGTATHPRRLAAAAALARRLLAAIHVHAISTASL